MAHPVQVLIVARSEDTGDEDDNNESNNDGVDYHYE